MPIYEYQCGKCGHEFEREQRIIEDPIKRCPACKSQKAKRLISNTSFVLKGSGWYKDLYSSSGGKSEPAAETKAEDKSEKTEKSDKGEKSDKSEKTEKSDKGEKSDKSEKTDAKAKDSAKGKKKSAA